MTKVIVTESYLEDIADSIRAKTGSNSTLKPSQMSSAIDNISTGTDTSDATLNSNGQMLNGVTAYSNGTKYTGNIPSKSSSDLTASGATVTVPAGHYASQATKSVSSGSASAPSTISGTSATVSTGTNTLTLSKTVSVTPSVTAGYISSGTATNSSVSLQASVTTKGSATITPTTTDQTISSGTYITGTQTIKGDANLVAGNIKSGVSIFNIQGTYTGGGGSSKNIQAYLGYTSRTANSYGSTTVTLTVAKAGTYKVSWTAWRGSSSGTMGTNLYKNSTAGTNQQTWTGTYGQCITLNNQTYAQGDVLTLYATSGSNSRTVYVGNLIIEEQ